MKYSKPEANNLGQAKSVIETNHSVKPPFTAIEQLGPPKTYCSPAYDLDE
jgi:hypothetical protein